MKNYLFYTFCFTEDSINECRYALLKFLAVYNLIPPANINVIVYTSKAASFEIFLSYFKSMQIVEALPTGSDHKTRLQKIAASCDGNLLFSHTYCYIKKPIDAIFKEIEKGRLLVYNKADNRVTSSTADYPSVWDAPVLGINSHQKGIAASGASTGLVAEQSIKADNILPVTDYFTNYKNLKELTKLLKIFFKRNEEESIPNLVKKVHHIDAGIIQEEVLRLHKLPLFKKWINLITGKNSLVQRYQNKL